MTDDLKELGRRAIACRGWRWMDGMLDGNIHEERYNAEHDGFLERDCDGYRYRGLLEGSLPDLSDPATLGCLLALVRVVWSDDRAWLEATNRYYAFNENGPNCCEPAWILHVLDQPAQTYRKIAGATEAEALVCALEMAS